VGSSEDGGKASGSPDDECLLGGPGEDLVGNSSTLCLLMPRSSSRPGSPEDGEGDEV